MLKLCCTSIIKPTNCLKFGTFPDEWKKFNAVPAHKKDNQIANNYCSVSLLPLCSKVFEKLGFDAIFEFITENNLLSSAQSRFKLNDSCINQFISITHSTFSEFDTNLSLEVCGVFLDLSNAFDKVWHEGLLYKLKIVE